MFFSSSPYIAPIVGFRMLFFPFDSPLSLNPMIIVPAASPVQEFSGKTVAENALESASSNEG